MTNHGRKSILLTLSATVLGLACLSLAGPILQKESQPAPGPVGSGTYSIDAVHSTVIFRIQHLKTSWSFGRFEKISGRIDVDEKNPEKSSVAISIDVDSLDTADEKRDGHLKSPDFFDAVQFSTATFTSKSVQKAGDAKYSVSGDLELHGVTKPITVLFEQVGFSDTKMGVRIGFYGTFTVKRSDFGISAFPDVLGDEVELTVSLEATRTDAKR